jgi:hypothetical protein
MEIPKLHISKVASTVEYLIFFVFKFLICNSIPHVDPEDEHHMGWSRKMHKFGLTKESSHQEQKIALLWALLASYLPSDVKSIGESTRTFQI